VRHQFLPHAQRIDTGVVGIAGKLILNADNRNGIAQEFLDGMALISAPGGLGMFIAAQIFADETAAKTGFEAMLSIMSPPRDLFSTIPRAM
jgi:hypothetical protein